MNKKIKRIVAFTLVISSFSIIEPIKHITLTNAVEANAAVVGAELEKISLGVPSSTIIPSSMNNILSPTSFAKPIS